jgi:putative ABC transport system permease protein
MFRTYIKIFFRNTSQHKGFTFINVIGLVVGIAVCVQVFIFVQYEKGFDKLHSNNIYRLLELKKEQSESTVKKVAQTAYPVGPALKAEFPQVKNFTRVAGAQKVPLLAPGKEPVTGTIIGVDASFLQVFSFALLKGDVTTALIRPRSIVLTQRISRSIFGNENPIGRMIRHEGRDTIEYEVTGLLLDPPAQSHLQFDALYSMSTYEGLDTVNNWEMDWIFTYLELENNADIKGLEAQLPAFLDKHMAKKPETNLSLFLQPLQETHLQSTDITRDALNTQKFNGNYLPPLIAVALFVLGLAVINYINLSTARSFTRAKEVAIRKTNGASRKQIAMQFLMETIILSFVALVVALAITFGLSPLFSRITGRNFTFDPFHQPLLLLIFFGLTMFTGVLSGIFPAVSLANLQPITALKGKLFTSHRSNLRNILVIAQFTISIGLSMVTLNVFRQLKFVREYDMGFNKEAVIVVPVSYVEKGREETMMQQLKQVPGVRDLTGSLRRLGNDNLDRNAVVFIDEHGSQEMLCTNLFVDFNYCSFYRIPFLAGRDLSSVFGNDRNRRSFVINESLARKLLSKTASADRDLSKLIGKNMRYSFDDSLGTIIGVVRDFNFTSLHQPIEPLCITYQNEYYFSDLSIRVDLKKHQEVVTGLQKVWKEFLPNQQFSYYFLDKQLEKLYESDVQTSQYVAIFTALAFIVACLGIIGMAAFNIERRLKEIGVRKVLGATVTNIVFLLSRDFLRLVLISIALALPLSFLAINKWMQNFAYRTDAAWWLFAVSGLAALCIAQLTISFQTIRAAVANPVASLRAE